MSEQTWKITGFNRHPSLMDTLDEEVVPIVRNGSPLKIATVPCSTGVEALSIAVRLVRSSVDFEIDGFDVDEGAIEAANIGEYFIDPISGDISGDPISGYQYQWCNLCWKDRTSFFDESEINGNLTIKPKPKIRSKVRFHRLGIQELPEGYDIIFCLNFLKYLTDRRFSEDLPSLEDVSQRLHNANNSIGALLVDPTSNKTEAVKDSLKTAGYTQLSDCAYLKC